MTATTTTGVCKRCGGPIEPSPIARSNCEACRAWHAARKRRHRAGLPAETTQSKGLGDQHRIPRGEVAVDTFTRRELLAFREHVPAVHRLTSSIGA